VSGLEKGLNEDKTIAYYDAHADEFVSSTLSVNMSHAYSHFVNKLPVGGMILDAGCGSGRDSLKFSELGFQVISMDASENLCILAQKLLNTEVLHLTFDQMTFDDQFDGIWACASLVHVSEETLSTVLLKLIAALKHDGILYASWKYGDSERCDNDRFFCDMNEYRLKRCLSRIDGIVMEEIWISQDVRESMYSQKWLNVIIRKANQKTVDKKVYHLLDCNGKPNDSH